MFKYNTKNTENISIGLGICLFKTHTDQSKPNKQDYLSNANLSNTIVISQLIISMLLQQKVTSQDIVAVHDHMISISIIH